MCMREMKTFNKTRSICCLKSLICDTNKIAKIVITPSEVNKKLQSSLPQSWNMNVAVIKKTRDLDRMTINEMKNVINACEMDGKQHAINPASSYIINGLNSSTNNALSSHDGFDMFRSILNQSKTPVYHSNTPSKAFPRNKVAIPSA